MALPRRSVHRSQHLKKSSQQRNCGVVLSRQHLHRMEVHWLPSVGPRKTYVLSAYVSERLLTPMSLAGSGKSVLWFVYRALSPWVPVRTYSSLVPPLFKTLRFYVKLDQPSWHTFTSIPGISTNKHITISCALSYLSFPLALVLAVTFSTICTRHTTMGLDSQLTTL